MFEEMLYLISIYSPGQMYCTLKVKISVFHGWMFFWFLYLYLCYSDLACLSPYNVFTCWVIDRSSLLKEL